ncbi:MAG: MBL fold metallo-hydrolase [Pseudomonadota bacterium]
MVTTTRRTVVLSAAATAALGLSGPLEFLPKANAMDMRKKGFVKYKVGDIECISLYDGIWQKKHADNFIRNASVDDTKAALTKAGLSADFVPIEFTQTVVKSGGKTILIDAGTGGQLAPTAGMTMKHMAAAGIDAGKVDTVVISHFHPDHIFGLMAKDTNAQTFPDAEIVVPEAEFKYWTDPAVISTLSKRRQGLAKRIQATLPTWKNVSQFGGDTEVAPGLRAVAAYGHTPGHTAFHVASGSDELLVVGDAANVPALFVANPTWQAVFDGDPKMATETRIKLFDRAVTDKAVIAGYHFGFPNAGTISKDGNSYVFQPA